MTTDAAETAALFSRMPRHQWGNSQFVESNTVVVLATSEAAASRASTVLADTAVAAGHLAALVTVGAKSGRHNLHRRDTVSDLGKAIIESGGAGAIHSNHGRVCRKFALPRKGSPTPQRVYASLCDAGALRQAWSLVAHQGTTGRARSLPGIGNKLLVKRGT